MKVTACGQDFRRPFCLHVFAHEGRLPWIFARVARLVCPRQARQRQVAGVVDHRREQALLGVDGETEVLGEAHEKRQQRLRTELAAHLVEFFEELDSDLRAFIDATRPRGPR
jgi:hypothetical protein